MRMTRLLTLIIVLSLGIAAAGTAGAAERTSPASAVAAKKGCKKKGKKGVAAAKKCKSKKKGKQPTATGPSLPIGEWACLNSGMQTLAGNKYTINRTDPGSYTYNPANGLVDFVGGSYDWAYGVFDPVAVTVEIYSNDPSVLPIGTYGWTCTKFGG